MLSICCLQKGVNYSNVSLSFEAHENSSAAIILYIVPHFGLSDKNKDAA